MFWWHSIDLGDGVVTPGEKTLELQEQEWSSLRLPSLVGKSVLDIGTWDGWFAFRAERAGAARVVALDWFVWSLDFAASEEYWDYVRACEARGEPFDAWGPECAWWDAEALLGKQAFDTAHASLASKVEPIVADFTDASVAELGPFDVVLFLGVLYHMREPLRALEHLRAVTRDLAVIETAAIEVDGFEDRAFVEFVPGYDVNSDPTNWYLPSEPATHGMCRAAGFASTESVARSQVSNHRPGISDYRLVVHAHT